MKIDTNMTVGNMIANKPVSGAAQPATAFADVLKGVEQSEVPGDVQGVTPLQPMAPLNLIDPQTITATSLSEEALDLLSTYSRALVDPQASLKDLAPMVGELGAMQERLGQAREGLATGDPLRGIMDEVGSLIQAEIVRFERGDLIG